MLALLVALAGPLTAPLDAVAQTPAASPSQAMPDTADGITVGPRSRVAALVPAEQIEAQAASQYRELLEKAAKQGALAPANHPQLVNLIGSRQINALCMPGGKIAFYTGILDTLKLTDDEVAMVMGHEIAHALREHGRERAGKAQVAQGLTIGASILSQLFGYGDLGGYLASGAAQLTMMKFGRDDETEADLVGMDIAARAGFDPRASIVLWQKMAAASKGQPPQWLSTHPSHDTRIEELRRNLQATLPVYARTRGVAVGALPAYRSNFGEPVR
jgi:predicted Zn-dependent protease